MKKPNFKQVKYAGQNRIEKLTEIWNSWQGEQNK